VNEVEILIVSNLLDFTTDYICVELSKRKCKYLRINRDQFRDYSITLDVDSCTMQIRIDNNDYLLTQSTLKAVYYRAPIYLHYIPRNSLTYDEQLYNSQWTAFIRNLTIFESAKWINNPNATFRSENKLLQLIYAKQSGFTIPKTRVANDLLFCELNENTMYAVKSLDTVILRSGEHEAFSYTSILTGKDVINSSLRSSPVVIQESIHPKIDIRATVVGNKVLPVKIVDRNDKGVDGDWRKQKNDVEFVSCELPKDIEESCICLTRKLGLFFGGIDLAFSNDRYYFIEINPTGEWAWLVHSAGLRIDVEICNELCCEEKNELN
jgi:glutathione synthase/RimK-type ligase-like ATP-grasp enzyme